MRRGIACLLLALAACEGTDTSETPTPSPNPRRELVSEADGWIYLWPKLSPDGKHLAVQGYVGRDGIALIDSGKRSRITPVGIPARDFAWMPDSGRLLVAFSEGTKSQLAIIGLNGTEERRAWPLLPFLVEDFGMAVAQDGLSAVVAGRVKPEAASDLFRVDLRTGSTHQITSTPGVSERAPAFLDSTHVLAVDASARFAEVGDLVAVDLDDGSKEALAPGRNVGTPSVVQGRFVVFESESEGLVRLSLDTSEVEVILPDADATRPTASADEVIFLLAAPAMGVGDLYRVTL